MAIPDPYKASRAKANATPVPRTTGSVPAPIGEVRKARMAPVASSGSVPAPTTTTAKTGLKPITATAGAVPKPPVTQKSAISTPEYTDWLTKQNEQYANLEKLVNTPFSYDPNTDPGYLAQRDLAQLRAGDATRNALETANERGILGSSMTTSQLGQIQQRAEQEAAAYIPEYRQQAYTQYLGQLQNAANLLGQARNLRGDQFNEGYQEAALTGTYKSPELKNLEQQLVNYKDQTEKNWSKMTPAQQEAARAEGNRIRSQIDALGGNSALFGADVASAAARGNMAQSGTRTLAGQQFDQGMKIDNWGAYLDMVGLTQNLGGGPQNNWSNLVNNANGGESTFAGNQNQFNQGITMAQLTGYLPDGTPTSAQQQQELSNLWMVAQQTGSIPNQLADLYGLPRGSRTQDAIIQAAKIGISQQNANTSAFSASNSAANAGFGRLMDVWQATGTAPAGLERYGISAGTPYTASSSSASSKGPTKNELEAEYYTNLDGMTPAQRQTVLKNEKQNIIADLGKSGYDELVKAYGS